MEFNLILLSATSGTANVETMGCVISVFRGGKDWREGGDEETPGGSAVPALVGRM